MCQRRYINFRLCSPVTLMSYFLCSTSRFTLDVMYSSFSFCTFMCRRAKRKAAAEQAVEGAPAAKQQLTDTRKREQLKGTDSVIADVELVAGACEEAGVGSPGSASHLVL